MEGQPILNELIRRADRGSFSVAAERLLTRERLEAGMLHLPMLAATPQGPGLPNLSCRAWWPRGGAGSRS